MTLTEFLLARIAEDEARARKIHADRCETPAETIADSMGRPMGPWCDCDWHVARVLAECEAKRRILELHSQPAFVATDGDEDNDYTRCGLCDELVPCDTLRALALPYADHDDFQEEWRP